MEKDKVFNSLRPIFKREELPEVLFDVCHSISFSIPWYIKIKDAVVSYFIWLIFWKVVISGPEDMALMGIPQYSLRQLAFLTMLAYYPVTLFWIHKTSIKSDEEYEREWAERLGKSSYTYRTGSNAPLHFKGFKRLICFFIIWSCVLYSIWNSFPWLVCQLLSAIPILIQFFPEIHWVYRKARDMKR